MADVITRFKLETTQYDSKLRDASKSLVEYTRKATQAGNEFGKFTQKNVEAARALGNITPNATNAKDKVKELVGAFNDAARAYSALTKEQQQSDFGKAMAESIGQLSQKIKEAKQELYGMGDAVKNTGGGGLFSGMGDKMSGALQVFAGNMLTKAAGAVANLGSEIFSSVQQGVELAKQGEGIRIAFERLGRGDLLDGLREATHGTVTDLELMKAAVKFNDFKLPVEELGTMLAFAQQKAKDTGQSVDYMVDSIVTGLGRKSLMILDNLGLSASEVKEKMAETGDMTKAVGEIIREQMSKAGDYVETAADRAAQANVNLQNKMEELGRKFSPLEEASNNLWTSMKIGILDVVGGPLTDFLNKLTEAGRLANQYGILGGNAKVGRMTANLAGASEGNRQSIYQQQQAQFWKYINQREQQLKDISAWQSGERNEALQKRVNAITQKYGSLDATKIRTEVDAAKKMLSEYQESAKTILNPIKADIDTKGAEQSVESLKRKLAELEAQRKKAIASGDTELSKNLTKQINQTKADIKGLNPTALKTTHKKTETVYAEGSIAAQSKIVSDLTKKWNEAGEDMRTGYLYQLIKAENKLKSIKDEQKALRDMTTWGDLKGAPVTGLGESSFSGKSLKDLQGVKLELKLPKDKTEASLTKEIGSMAGGISQMVGSMEALGIELPEGMKDVVSGVTSLISIVSGIATIVTAIEALTAADTIIPLARGGVVHAANGVVTGNTYSGDMIPAALNAGELVLNKAQQGNLASQLQGAGFGGVNMVGEISGESIKIVLNRHLKRTGQGEIVTW